MPKLWYNSYGSATLIDSIEEIMKLGDKVRASYPYGGVPACEGEIIRELVLRGKITQFFVSFEVRPKVFKNFYLTERELTLCVPATQQ